MTVTIDMQSVDLSTLKGAIGVTLDNRPFYLVDPESYERMARAMRNAEYFAMLDKADEQIRNGQVVVRTMEDLEAMAAE